MERGTENGDYLVLYTGRRLIDSVSHVVSSESFSSTVRSVVFEFYDDEDVG